MQSLFDTAELPLWRQKGNTANNDLFFSPQKKRFVRQQLGQLRMGTLPLVGSASFANCMGS